MPRFDELPRHLECQDAADRPADQLVGPARLKLADELHVLGGDAFQGQRQASTRYRGIEQLKRREGLVRPRSLERL